MMTPKQKLEEDFMIANAFKAKFFWNAFKALTFNKIDGDYVEFGSHGGRTFRLAFDEIQSRGIDRHMWAFDSFQGLPKPVSPKDQHPVWQQGAMSTHEEQFHEICQSHGIGKNQYSVISGFYDETLANMQHHKGPTNIALAYIDCDMYSSTKSVMEYLRPCLKHGMIIAFDDYFCWSNTHVSGERAAFLEFEADESQWRFMRYRDYGWAGTSYVVEKV